MLYLRTGILALLSAVLVTSIAIHSAPAVAAPFPSQLGDQAVVFAYDYAFASAGPTRHGGADEDHSALQGVPARGYETSGGQMRAKIEVNTFECLPANPPVRIPVLPKQRSARREIATSLEGEAGRLWARSSRHLGFGIERCRVVPRPPDTSQIDYTSRNCEVYYSCEV